MQRTWTIATARVAIGAVAVAAIAVFLVIVTADERSAGPDRGVTLADVLAEPKSHLGETVTVTGEVARVNPAPGAFTIGDRIGPQENELFVLPTQSASFDRSSLDAQSVVRVGGTIRRITPETAADDDLLFDDEEDDALDEFEGELAVEATSVDVALR